MSNFEVFNKSVIGAGHIAKNKPCQDYSICENNNGIQVLVVCDGHGGTSYVRSHIGAKLAAINTRRILITFAQSAKPDTFSGVEMSVTAQPQRNPFIDADGNKVRYQDLDETQQEVARQAQEYIAATEHHKEEQFIVNGLISQIITQWKEDIEEDARIHKFTKEENAFFSNKDLTKAYGCTVLAYLRTPYFWLALQIGDGKIVCCNEHFHWTEPVPRDCECFLNMTTSLCDKSPEKEFRYAFSGKGDFPTAVFLNSDGVDGSFGNKENLQSFYFDIINLFQDDNINIQTELEEYLPKLSEQGNHDDMSIAGMIDLGWLKANNELMGLIKEEHSLREERESKLYAINQLNSSLESINARLEILKETSDTKLSELNSWWHSVQNMRSDKENELQSLQAKEAKLTEEKKRISTELKKAREELDKWNFSAKRTMAEIEEKRTKHQLRQQSNYSINSCNEIEENKLASSKEQPSIDSHKKIDDGFWD